jgi:hypothetical protein
VSDAVAAAAAAAAAAEAEAKEKAGGKKASVAAVPARVDDPTADLRLQFMLDGPEHTFALQSWMLDAVTFKGIKLSLPAAASLRVFKCVPRTVAALACVRARDASLWRRRRLSGCRLSAARLSELLAVLPAATGLHSVGIDFNPLEDGKLDEPTSAAPSARASSRGSGAASGSASGVFSASRARAVSARRLRWQLLARRQRLRAVR